MYCPRCLSPLKAGPGLKTYQTLVEHVCSPNSRCYPKEYYICSKESCITHRYDMFWDNYGDSYGGVKTHNDLFILSDTTAVNSCGRKLHIEQKKQYRTLAHLLVVKVGIESIPITDKYGTHIFYTKHKPKVLLKSSTGWVEYTPGIKMFFFCIKQFNYAFNRFLEDPTVSWTHSEMLSELIIEKWDKRWWRLLSSWTLNKMYPNLKERLLCLKKN